MYTATLSEVKPQAQIELSIVVYYKGEPEKLNSGQKKMRKISKLLTGEILYDIKMETEKLNMIC
ncbi:MAG: hypothetical protein LUC94_06695 [Clostridiales bacterium]|nr:hypothetical protein [Clostridiales bacterium]